MDLEILALVFGVFGIAANVVIYQQNTGKRLLACKLISDFIWLGYYLCLGGLAAVGVSCIGVIRESVFLNHGKRWADTKLWLLGFAALAIAVAIITWKSPLSILPAVASLLSVFGFWMARPMLSRILAYPIATCMLLYSALYLGPLGIIGAINECFTLVSTTVALVIAFVKYKRSCSSLDLS